MVKCGEHGPHSRQLGRDSNRIDRFGKPRYGRMRHSAQIRVQITEDNGGVASGLPEFINDHRHRATRSRTEIEDFDAVTRLECANNFSGPNARQRNQPVGRYEIRSFGVSKDARKPRLITEFELL